MEELRMFGADIIAWNCCLLSSVLMEGGCEMLLYQLSYQINSNVVLSNLHPSLMN